MFRPIALGAAGRGPLTRCCVLWAFSLALALWAAQPARAHAGHGAPPLQRLNQGVKQPDRGCNDAYRKVRGQGPSCRVDGGLWKVKLRNGDTVFTHGPDPLPEDLPGAIGASGVLSGDVIPRQPICASSNAFHAIIAVPGDAVQDKTVASFRDQIRIADGALYQSAVESGSPNGAHFRFVCDTAGQIRVDTVRLATPRAQATWSTILSDLAVFGHDKTAEKYAVYYDAALPGATCGQGSMNPEDTSAGWTNKNNVGPDWAVVNNCDNQETLLHEMLHNLGAVPPGAPYATGWAVGVSNYGHCFKSLDVMCYNDGAPTDPGFLVSRCTDFDHVDCGHDSYFDAAIDAGQGVAADGWLARNWNIGACYVAFVSNAACDKVAPTVSRPVDVVNAGSQAGASALPVRLTWTGADTGGSGLAKYTLFQSTDGAGWVQVPLASSLTRSVVRSLQPGHRYAFVVGALDNAGNRSAWAYGPTFTLSAKQENDAAIAYTGSWSRNAWASAAGGFQSTAGVAGRTAKLTFTGRNVAWVAPLAGNRGRAYVYVDGTYVRTVDLYSATTVARRVVYSQAVASGTHTVTVYVAGTTGRPWVDVDEFAVIR